MDTLPRYEDDYVAWTQDQCRRLREAAAAQINAPIDCENLAEEIESMGRSDLSAVESALMRVSCPLLKLEFSPAADPRAGWMASVVEHRNRIRKDLKASPSLRGKLEPTDEYRTARRIAALGLKRDGITIAALPETCSYTLDQLLDEDWWPANRHGLEEEG